MLHATQNEVTSLVSSVLFAEIDENLLNFLLLLFGCLLGTFNRLELKFGFVVFASLVQS